MPRNCTDYHLLGTDVQTANGSALLSESQVTALRQGALIETQYTEYAPSCLGLNELDEDKDAHRLPSVPHWPRLALSATSRLVE